MCGPMVTCCSAKVRSRWLWVALLVVACLAMLAGGTYLAYSRDLRATRDALIAGQFLSLATGGHLPLGHHTEVRARANAFLRQHAVGAGR